MTHLSVRVQIKREACGEKVEKAGKCIGEGQKEGIKKTETEVGMRSGDMRHRKGTR